MRTYTLPAFGGLDLRDDPEGTPGAIDLLNIDFGKPGRIRTRDGTVSFAAATSMSQFLVNYTNGAVVGSGATVLKAYDNTGALTATSAALAGFAYSLVQFGTPAGNSVYAGIGDANTHIAKWNGAAFSYPVAGYSGQYVAATPWDNRLVLGNQIGPTADGSLVRFSDAGAPETYTANSYVDLTPGDGESIRGMVVWRNQLFVFKWTKFFVFYGTTTDSTGNPIFNYRTVDSGIGIDRAGDAAHAVVAGPDGVYFYGQDGMYRTTGGPPVKVSSPVDPLFRANEPAGFTSRSIASYTTSSVWLGRYQTKILMSYQTQVGTSYMLAYETDTGLWSLWDLSARAILEYRNVLAVVQPTTSLMYVDLSGNIMKLSVNATDDNGVAITSRYRTGFLDLGTPDAEKHIRELIFDGTGTVTVKRAVNDATTLGTGQSVALGTSPAVAQGRDRRGLRGRNISVDVSSSAAQWSLSRLTVNVQSERPSGAKATR